MLKIAVLYGGISGEREVSLSSGRGIIEALKNNGHTVIGIDFHPERLDELFKLEVDLVFIGLHGKFGEDGRIQGLLDMLSIPYVGSGTLSSALAMDKEKAKDVFEMHDIPVAKSKAFRIKEKNSINEIAKEVLEKFQFPFVVKPNSEGSTLGLTIVEKEEQIMEALKKAVDSDDVILVEDFIKGKELTVPVLGAVGEEKALPIIEIIPKNDHYDYESKYSPGGSEHIVPADLPMDITNTIKEYAVRAHQSLDCEIYSRVDFILTNENIPVILEVNTLPGMTPTSLFPDAAKAVGLTYEQMIEEIVRLSIN